jgi:DNA polymerase type B, organellar and viral
MKVAAFVKIVGHSSGIIKSSHISDRKSHHEIGTKGFIAVDGEGITLPNGEHRYVLFGVGDDQIEDENGLEWYNILAHIYRHRRDGYAFVGFYLSYDFDRWIRTMPYDRAYRLVTTEGRTARRSKSAKQHNKVLPVDMSHGWQINMLGKKMFEFRKRTCNCDLYYCKHPKGPFVRVCDSGPFFQSSFLKAIDPRKWTKPIVTMAEYELIEKNKKFRAYATEITDEMRYYNKLENRILVRLMNVLNDAFKEMGIVLAPNQWFGPGQAAQKWMKNECIPKNEDIYKAVPQQFSEAARMSYFGGWFEIMMHGIIPGESHEYDINSAYPYIISSLPCLLHGEWRQGSNTSPPDTKYVLVYASVSNYQNKRASTIGTMLHREYDSSIKRPDRTKGWFWLSEINAAKKAKTIRYCHIYEWMSYDPCDCLPPMRNVQLLYDLRIKVGKDTPLGKGCRLAYNSMYGKFAQSIGDPIFANPIYASLITSGCRTMILEAIASHPKGKDDVCMVATDAVFFATPHPGLPISKRLGDWDYQCRNNLTLFKPGVYWDDETRRDIDKGESPYFKSRGVAAADFAHCISEIDGLFQKWERVPPPYKWNDDGIVKGWPAVFFEAGFAMTTCLQAIRRGKWETAGEVNQHVPLMQNSNPYSKRIGLFPTYLEDGRKVWRSIPWHLPLNDCESMPYIKRFGMADPWSDEYMEQDGINQDAPFGMMVRESIGLDG